MTPQRGGDAAAVTLGHEALRAVVGPELYVRTQLPLALGAASEPEPDLAIVKGSPRDHREHHPASALLVIEIADARWRTVVRRRGDLYARFGIREYWIVNLVERLVEVYRHPEPDDRARFGFSYRRVDRYHPGDAIAPQAVPGASIAVSDLLP